MTLVGIVVCSLLVAVFWSINIGTVYPLVEVVFQGKSAPEWVDEQVDAYQSQVDTLEDQISQLSQSGTASGQIQTLESKLETASNSLAWRQKVQPVIHDFMPTDPFQTMIAVVVFMLCGTVIKGTLLMANMILVERFTQQSMFSLRNQFYRNTLQMELASFGNDRTSGLMSRFTNDMNQLRMGVNSLLGKTVREPLKMAACLVGAALISWQLLLFCLVITPIAGIAISALAKAIKRASKRAMEEMSNLYKVLSESFGNIEVVKGYTMEEHEQKRFHETAEEYYHKSMRIAFFNSLSRPTTEILGMTIVGLGMLSGGYLVLRQQTHLFGIEMTPSPLGFGEIMTFFAMLVGASDPLRKLADVFNSIQRSTAAADRIFELADRQPAVKDPEDPIEVPENLEHIEFRNVSFHYHEDNLVLQDINLRLNAGQTVALVGPNGCGKSTLARMITRFQDPTVGSVLVNGIDVREFKQQDLRSGMGLVTQKALLFDQTVCDNILYGSKQVGAAAAVAAAKQAKAHQFISEKLPEGYDTVVGEGGNKLSGGQRQRIALARAILRDPKVMILDEATSQVDLESEQVIHQVLREFLVGRTAVMITHRLSTLDLADRIIVMDKGRIVDDGTHDELMSRCAIYQRMTSAGRAAG